MANNKGATYRHRTAIVNSILRAITNEHVDQTEGILVTHLMYTAYVNHTQLTKYLEEMEKQGLIKVDVRKDANALQKDKKHAFITATPKGHEFIKLYDTMEHMTNVL